MISRRTVISSLAFGAALGFVGSVLGSSPVLAAVRGKNPIWMLDPDHDGTVDLAEAKQAASAMFRKLDHDHDGTLDARELKGRLSAADFGAADPDHD
jgi:hypothetical protein